MLVPLGFQLQGLYRLRRGRSRVDDFFAVFVGSILAVVFGIVATLYVQTYYVSEPRRTAAPTRCRRASGRSSSSLNVVLTYASRELVREVLERRWRAGIGLKRILIAGVRRAGPPRRRQDPRASRARLPDRRLRRRPGGRRSPRLPRPAAARHDRRRGARSSQREAIDHLYVALPPEEHVQMLELIESTSREMRRRQGRARICCRSSRCARGSRISTASRSSTSTTSRCRASTASSSARIDIAISAAALVVLAHPARASSRCSIRLTSHGPVFYRQERMGLDGKPFTIFKFRSMYDDAEDETGPVWARDDDPRVHAARPLPAPLEHRRAAAALERAARATCRSSGRGPSGRTSSSSSSTGSRSTCCATR